MTSVSHWRYAVGAHRKTASLQHEGVTREQILQLLVRGAEGYFQCQEALFDVACQAARASLQAWHGDRADIDVVLLGSNSLRAADFDQDFGHQLLHELGLSRAYVQQTGFQNCADCVLILRTAKALVDAGAAANVLVLICDDVGAAGIPRILKDSYLHSDGAACALVSRSNVGFVLGDSQIIHARDHRGSCSDPHDLTANLDWLLGAAREMTSVAPDFVITHNMNRLYWQMVAKAFNVPQSKVFSQPEKGHFLAADVLINMKDMTDQGMLKHGDQGLVVVPTSRSVGIMLASYCSGASVCRLDMALAVEQEVV